MANNPTIKLPFFRFEIVFELKENDEDGEKNLRIVPKLRHGSSYESHHLEHSFSEEEVQQVQAISDYINMHLPEALLDSVSIFVGEATIGCILNREYVSRFNPKSKNLLYKMLGRMFDPETSFKSFDKYLRDQRKRRLALGRRTQLRQRTKKQLIDYAVAVDGVYDFWRWLRSDCYYSQAFSTDASKTEWLTSIKNHGEFAEKSTGFTKLTDELILRIGNISERDREPEALACYHAALEINYPQLNIERLRKDYRRGCKLLQSGQIESRQF